MNNPLTATAHLSGSADQASSFILRTLPTAILLMVGLALIPGFAVNGSRYGRRPHFCPMADHSDSTKTGPDGMVAPLRGWL